MIGIKMDKPGATTVEIRFDSDTFSDLPYSDRGALVRIFNDSPMVAETYINGKPRNEELDELYFEQYGKPRPHGGLGSGLGEAFYIYVAITAAIAGKKLVEKTVEELTKRAFEWLDTRYKRRKEVGLAEVTIYGPDGKQINTQAIVYDGRSRKKE